MKKIVLLLILGYQRFVSQPMVRIFGGGCRFQPTCSEYSRQAIDKYGVAKGVKLSLIRLTKCHPLSQDFGWDPLK